MSVAAILLAGGSGTRMRTDFNKVYLPIGSRDLLELPLEVFERSTLIDRIVLVIRAEDRARTESVIDAVGATKPCLLVPGGATRHESERNGLEALATDIETGEVELVAIHDGARPFVTIDLLRRLIVSAREVGGAIPGLPMESPTYRVDGGRAEPLEQTMLRRVQTPQVFRAKPLLEGYRRSSEVGFAGVDTAETVRRFTNLDVTVVPGDDRNIKVTFVEDMFAAEDLAVNWSAGRWVDRASN